jgi:AraC family transcriptional regulator, chitin signaling transcriptional activator
MFNLKQIIILFLFTFFGFAQELPPIVKYNPTTYGAGNQNWMISQDENHFIFFANNEGLLEFNGSNWTLYPSPNESIIRSVKVIDNKIYTGSYMEFGFWTRHSNGRLKYQSLSNLIKDKIVDDEQFWNILNYDQWVIFQSFSSIYIYDTITKKVKIISALNNISKSFRTNNSIYYQTYSDGLLEIENGKSKLVSNNPILLNNRIINIFSIEEGLLIQTEFNGFYKLINGNVTKFSIEADKEIGSATIYSSQKLADGGYAIGTVSNGIYILSSEGKVRYHITQTRGLSNNTALSLFEDLDKNLWIGLDNGINCINIQSPVKSFSDDTGILGTVYTSLIYQQILYIGTNQGLFYKKYGTDDQFQFISGTKGQVWSLFEYDGTVFCGHNNGCFIIENGTAKNIFNLSGTWKFITIPNQKNFLLQGNYFGISVLEKVNAQWVYRNKIVGFGYSSRFLEVTNDLEVYVSHEYKGVFRVELDKKMQKASKVTTYKYPTKGKNACLTKFNNEIYYAYKEGIFKLNETNKKFVKDKLLSEVFEKDQYTSGNLMVDKSNKLWLFSKNYIHYFSLNKLSFQLKQNAIPIPASLTNSMLGYENINQISNYEYLIGTTDGYYTININDLSFKNYSISISNISVNKQNEGFKYFSIQSDGDFKFDENNITFTYTIPEYNKYINAEYQYLLEGIQNDWSQWSAKSTINFKNLSSGSYTFKVRARIANSTPENIATYKFSISKPWYATNLALIFYLILILILAYFINKFYTTNYQKQREKLIEENNLLLEIKELENEQQLMKVRNEQLTSDFDAKNRELAVSTMSLIKKNELLSMIKDDLKKTNEDGNRSVKSVITTISKNINEEDNWTIFKEAFDNADKDFLKKVKTAHPLLTPNDLRLCAYLRLNLSSKEIAPLLSISVRSIEIKRYRLRKKMELLHEQGLVEYILSI